ncbi:Fatty-acid amide hydrolase 2, partial [Linderina macrospora]
DIAPFVSAMIGRDIGDPKSVNLSNLRVVAFPDGFGWQILLSSVEPDVRQAVVNVADFLGKQVVGQSNVVFAKAPAYTEDASLQYVPNITTGEIPLDQKLVGPNRPPFSWWRELIPILLGRSDHTLNAFILSFLETTTANSVTRDMVKPFWDRLDKYFSDLMGDNGVLIFPTSPQKAQPHGVTYFNFPNFIYTGAFNVLGYPSTQVPLGLSKDGLPLGVQVIAKNGQDLKTIAVALALEKRFGGWTPPRRFGAPVAESEMV